MRASALKAWWLCVFCFVGGGFSHSSAQASAGRRVQQNAPPVVCTVRMNFWCIVQADSGLSMTDHGDYRIWRMSASGGGRHIVSIREDKSCDSPSDVRVRKKYEKDVRMSSGELHHVVGFAISADGVCTLNVDYVVGNSDIAREATQMVNYRIYLCDGSSCRRSLFSVGKK